MLNRSAYAMWVMRSTAATSPVVASSDRISKSLSGSFFMTLAA